MRTIILLFSLSLVASCATKPKRIMDWYNPSGELATSEEVAELKAGCKFDKKISEASQQIRTGISIGRYDSQYGAKASDKYSAKAADVMMELRECMRATGFTTRERAKN